LSVSKAVKKRDSVRRWRVANPELNRLRQCEYFKRWRGSHRSIRLAQRCVPLGVECEFCGSVVDLMRFHLDYDFPLVVVTVCRVCRGWVRKEFVRC
jgi:hypothetical protein